MGYWNTTNEIGQALKDKWQKTERQQDFVLRLFKEHKAMTASEAAKLVLDHYQKQFMTMIGDAQYIDIPLKDIKNNLDFLLSKAMSVNTSVRRSITDLYNAGKIKKTEEKRKGVSGSSNFIYVINEV